MQIKTLGVFVVTVLALFTMFLWMTDGSRRTAMAKTQEEELLTYGGVVFANDPTNPASAGCARCHGDDGMGGPVPNDPNGAIAPNLHSNSIAKKLKVNDQYVHLVVSYGGVVVSGNVNSPMPAWSTEVGGPLTVQQIDAVVALVTSWAEAAPPAPSEVPNTADAGKQVFSSAGCAGCHGANLEGAVGPNLQTIGSELVTEGLPVPPSGLDQMKADYAADPKDFLDKWIRDSANNYNGGTPTGMPPHPVDTLGDSQLQALITFLLEQKQ
ncbi:MAG TPA: c-type cytochrome [Candidatus Limnocylindria bacterium]|jgi:mono/diheme cytochrome c family protein|nr:c-type cytochrome [Candidatus Limnocylindria bacterium]